MTRVTSHVCPECQGVLMLDVKAEAGTVTFCPNPGGLPYLERGIRPAVVCFCMECEFALEVVT